MVIGIHNLIQRKGVNQRPFLLSCCLVDLLSLHQRFALKYSVIFVTRCALSGP